MNILQLRAIVSPTVCYHVHSLKKEKSEKSGGEGVGIEKKRRRREVTVAKVKCQLEFFSRGVSLCLVGEWVSLDKPFA